MPPVFQFIYTLSILIVLLSCLLAACFRAYSKHSGITTWGDVFLNLICMWIPGVGLLLAIAHGCILIGYIFGNLYATELFKQTMRKEL